MSMALTDIEAQPVNVRENESFCFVVEACCSSVWFRSIGSHNWFQNEPTVASDLQRFQGGLSCRRIRTVVEDATIDQRHGEAACGR